MHLLVDRLMRPKSCEKVSQNSFLFQLKLSMLLSSMVQMKNSLVKYLDYETSDRVMTAESEKGWEESQILTPQDPLTVMSEAPPNCRQNMHLMVVTDDIGIIDH